VLVEHGADVDARDRDGCLPLHVAANCCEDEGVHIVELIEWLLLNGADVNALDVNGCTPLDWANNAIEALEEETVADFIRQHGGVSGKDLAPNRTVERASVDSSLRLRTGAQVAKESREPLELNRLGLNQLAKKLLQHEGEYADPYYLYSLQLLRWWLEKYPDHLARSEKAYVLRHNAVLMLGWESEACLPQMLNMQEESDALTLQDAADLVVKNAKRIVREEGAENVSAELLGALLVDGFVWNLDKQMPWLGLL